MDELARRVRQLESELAAAEQRAERHLKSLRAFMQLALFHDANGRLEADLRRVAAKLGTSAEMSDRLATLETLSETLPRGGAR